MRALCLKICNLIEVFTRNIFDEQQQIINSIKVIREKRKKNKILKVQEAKNYEKAKKNKKDIQKYEEAYRRRTQKFENYQYQFVYDVEMLNNGKTEFIKKIFGAILFYSKEIIEVQNNVIDSIFIKYCSEPIKSLFPTCNAAEPKFEEISYGNDENLI